MSKPNATAANPDAVDFDDSPAGNADVDFGNDPSTMRHGVAKAGAIAPVLKSALLHTLTEGVERTMALADIVRGATVATEKSETPLPAVIGEELRSIEGILSTVSTMAKVGECPGGFVKDPKTGKCGPPTSSTQKAETACPDGQVWSSAMGKCVPESEMRKSDVVISADVKKRLLADLSVTIQKAMDLRNVLQGATDADAGTVIPQDVGLHMRAIASGLGNSLGRFASPAAKAFVLVDAESEPTMLAKAGAALALTAEQQTQVTTRLEKAIDGLSESMMALDRVPEHDEANPEVPGYVSAAAEVAIGNLRGLSGLVVKAVGEEPPAADPAPASDPPAAPAPAPDPAPATATAAPAPAPAPDPAPAPAPATTPTDPPAAADPTDTAKAIKEGLAEAMKPFVEDVNKRFDKIEAEGKHNTEVVQKMASTVPAPNAAEPGSTRVAKSDAGGEGEGETFGEGWAGDPDDDWGRDEDEGKGKGKDSEFSF